MIIRPAQPADRDFVLALADRLVSFDVPAFRTKDELAEGDRRALAEWFRDPKPDEALFVAELNGRPAGCAYLVT
ncbi:MAG: GNAT family N-acetyltransferase, partial [Acidobacteriota bacterium]|nr:GNAT family N-acetyltransferase [Acidobacteriota bacterium]